jgi:outer membrane protein OmpA-like peptidoglycan-associated protein
MGRVREIVLAGMVLATFVPLASFDIARGDPAMRLAQVPLTPEQQKEFEQKKKQPPATQPRPPAQPPAAQPKPPGPPAQVPPAGPPQRPAQTPPAHPPQGAPAQIPPAGPAQRPAQTAPTPPAPGEPQRRPQGAPAQIPPTGPAQRPAQTAPTPPAPGEPPRRPQGAPAQIPPAGPAQRPAQTAPTPPAGPAQQPAQSAPAQIPPAGPAQRPAQSAPAQPTPGQPPQPPQGAPAQIPPAGPAQRPAQSAPAQPTPGQPPQALQGAPAQVQPGGPAQRPAQAAPLPAPPAPPAAQAQPLQPAGPGEGIAPRSAQGQPMVKMQQLQAERHQTVEGNRTIIREPDRVIIREGDGRFVIRHSEVDRFRYNARDVRVERQGNNNVTIVVRPDGGRVVNVLDDNGRLVRRSRVLPDGREIVLIEDRGPMVANYNYYVELPPPVIRIPRERYIVETERASPEMIYEALVAPPIERLERPYTLEEIRYSPMLRERMPRIDLDTINFEFGSWEVPPDQLDRLAVVAEAITRVITRNPREVFLIEGHTDAVGSDVDNLSLSDRRAESVALALSDRFQVPAENLSTQGYGKQYLKVPTDAPERQNRRVTVRRITPLLAGGG